MKETTRNIIIVASESDFTNILYHKLSQYFLINKIILEEKPSSYQYLWRSYKRQGIFYVIGFVLFKIFVFRYLLLRSRKRIRIILDIYKLNVSPIPSEKIIRVSSVNSSECIHLLGKLNPDLIIICGTRIISEKVLTSVNAGFMNMHAGVTPIYRGVHGAYWALVNKDEANCGVTVHMVDKGIDTGSIIAQGKIPVDHRSDNFCTYPYIQTAVGMELMIKAMNSYFEGTIVPIEKGDQKSKLWFHPTVAQYLYNFFVKRVK